MARILKPAFYRRETEVVARELLGCTLVHIVNGRRVSGTIVETEAYLGITDRACHSFGNRRTSRTESMYLPGGYAYVYFIYGMYHCFNVVTREVDIPEAVLIRALEPREGIDFMREMRPTARSVRDLTNGPGKLAMALSIDRSCDRVSLNSDTLFIETSGLLKSAEIVASPRVGINYAGECMHWPLRFSIRNHPFVSKPLPWRNS